MICLYAFITFESLKVYQEIIDKMEENDRLAAIEEAQNCPNR